MKSIYQSIDRLISPITYFLIMQGYVTRDAQGRPQQKARLVILNSNAGVVPGQPNASCASPLPIF